MSAPGPRAALAVVIADGLLGRLAFGMLTFALPLYSVSLGLSVAEVGVLVSLRTIPELLAKPVAGWLTDRVGLRWVYVGGLAIRVIAAAGLLVAGSFFGLVAVRLLQGISSAGRDVGSLGLMARDARGRVATVYGWYASARHVGNVGGAGAAGLIIAASAHSFTALFTMVLGLSV